MARNEAHNVSFILANGFKWEGKITHKCFKWTIGSQSMQPVGIQHL